MNKIEFEQFLREKLKVLKTSEVDEIVNEYLQHIELAMAEGKSEEEAILEFGNLNVLVNELLDAYKINHNNNQLFDDIALKVKLFLNRFFDYINNIANSLMNRSSNEILTLIVEFILVLLLIWVLNGLVDVSSRVLMRPFYFRPFFITRLIRTIINFVRVFLNFTIAIAILYWFSKERVIDYQQEFKTTSNKSQPNTTSDVNTFVKRLLNVNLKIFKLFSLIIVIPLIVFGVLLGISYVYLLYATISGFGSVGILTLMSGILLMYYAITIGLINFIGGEKQ